MRRENLQRLVEVTARFEGIGMGAGMDSVKKAVAGLHLPSAIRVEYGGLYEEQQRSFRELTMVFLLALVLLFGVLLFEFRNFSAPVAILVSALLSSFGGFPALLLTRNNAHLASSTVQVTGLV